MGLMLIVACYFIINVVTEGRISLDKFPNPLTEEGIQLCGRERGSFICDPNGFLSQQSADQIDEFLLNATKSKLVWCPYIKDSDNQFISNPNKKTRDNYNGLQIGVAIIDSFKHYDHSRLRRETGAIAKKCKIYAKSIHDQWGVGEAGCNNAVMIFVTIYDRYLYISTGSGIKHVITDSFLDEFLIPHYVKPLMRASKYDEAIEVIVKSIVEVLRESDDLSSCELYQQYIEYTTPFSFLGLSAEVWIWCGIILTAIGCLGWKFHSERDYRECSRKLATLYAQKQAKKFASTSCPICLEEFAAMTPTTSPNTNTTTEQKEDGNGHGNERRTAVLICGHKFCKECLDSWFASQSAANQKCPICRHDRDDWSCVAVDEKDEDEKKQGSDDVTAPLLDDDDEQERKRNDDENDVDDEKNNNFPHVPHAKTSTSDTFYANGNTGSNEQRAENGMFEFRNRNRRRDGMNWNDWMFQQEMMFRMRRIRHYYPRYVTNDMADRWMEPNYQGSFTNDRSFQRANPNYRPPQSAATRSSWSGGGSFGGGSSGGGGGGGGGW